nr:monovalent cation/H+ antiporter subunit D [Caldovatus aquaticus]
MVAAILLLAVHSAGAAVLRGVGLAAVALLAAVAVLLLAATAQGAVAVVAIGAWPPPFGIVLVADRLSATMVAVTAAVAVPALLAATDGTDLQGRHFHPFFQMQLAGLNGAFLTGDLFNLFVFFEVLLIASYALLAHGAGAARVRAGLHYVVLNLAASLVFLVGLALLYGALGTLNLADVAGRLAALPLEEAAPARAGLALIAGVFAFKAALLPLGFWLPHAYPAAAAPVAALFAVLTKVGIYALLRLSSVALADDAPAAAGLVAPWLMPAAIGTVVAATLGVLAAPSLGAIAAHLLLLSTGMLAAGVAEGSAPMLAAVLYYLPHTTLVSAGLFLLAGHIAATRGEEARDRIRRGPRLPRPGLVGGAYLALAVAVTGLPPLSGFLGKVMLLAAAPATPAGYAMWASFLLSGFVAALALARAASVLFWERSEPRAAVGRAAPPRLGLALAVAVGFVPLLVLGAAPLSAHARATAEQVAARRPYLEAVLPRDLPPAARERRP